MKNKRSRHIRTIVYAVLLLSVMLLGFPGLSTSSAKDRNNRAVDWNDDHSGTGFMLQWKGMKFNTKYHAYHPSILGKHALDALEYNESPPDGMDNYWFPQNVQIDPEKNELQLVMRRFGPKWEGQPVWSCAEVVLEEKLYYGKYSITVNSYGTQATNDQPVDPDPWGALFEEQSVVLGIFTYDKNADPDFKNTYKEIDIVEIFGKAYSAPPNIGNAQFVVQPYDGTPQNLTRITLLKPDSGLLTFEMDWKKDSVYYTVRDGNKIVARHRYTNTEYIPVPNENMRLHINLWVFGGPWNAKPIRVGITDIQLEKHAPKL